MSDNSLTEEIAKLKKKIIFLFLIIFVLGIFVLLQFNKKGTNLSNISGSDYAEIIVQLERELDDLRSEIETTKTTFESSLTNYQETINLLREPNVLSPFHTYSGQAGIVYRNTEGEGRWVPNSYAYELSLLIDQAVRNAKARNILYPKKYILVNYHLDEIGPSVDIIFDLEKSKVLINEQQYVISGDDLGRIINFLETNSVDGSSR